MRQGDLLPTWRGYRAAWLPADTIAGLTVWAVLVPEALAYATIAGVPPVVGLYAAVPSLIVYAALGSSRQLVVGPMAATAAISASIVAGFAPNGTPGYASLTAALALVTGVLAVAMGLLRLGFLAAFISGPVLKGFIIGLALSIIAGQLPAFFGITKGGGEFFEQLWYFLGHLSATDAWSLGVGLGCLATVVGFRRWLPAVPGSLVAVVLAIAFTAALHLDTRGVAVVGPLDAGLPELGLPRIATGDWLRLAGPALGVVLVGFAEGLGAAKTFAARDGSAISANRELVGLGAANLGSGLASGMVVNGSLSKTAVNAAAGARSQISCLLVSVLTGVTLLFLTGLFRLLPEAALAAIVIAALVELVDIPALRRLWRVSLAPRGERASLSARPDFFGACAALLAVLILGTLRGLIVGVTVSIMLLVYRASRPPVVTLGQSDGQWLDVSRHPDARTEAGIAVLRPEGSLFFANADHVRQRVTALATTGGTRAVILDGETVPGIDVTAAVMFADLTRDLHEQGVELYLAHSIGAVRDVLRRAGISLPHVQPAIADALRVAEAKRGSPPTMGST